MNQSLLEWLNQDSKQTEQTEKGLLLAPIDFNFNHEDSNLIHEIDEPEHEHGLQEHELEHDLIIVEPEHDHEIESEEHKLEYELKSQEYEPDHELKSQEHEHESQEYEPDHELKSQEHEHESQEHELGHEFESHEYELEHKLESQEHVLEHEFESQEHKPEYEHELLEHKFELPEHELEHKFEAQEHEHEHELESHELESHELDYEIKSQEYELEHEFELPEYVPVHEIESHEQELEHEIESHEHEPDHELKSQEHEPDHELESHELEPEHEFESQDYEHEHELESHEHELEHEFELSEYVPVHKIESQEHELEHEFKSQEHEPEHEIESHEHESHEPEHERLLDLNKAWHEANAGIELSLNEPPPQIWSSPSDGEPEDEYEDEDYEHIILQQNSSVVLHGTNFTQRLQNILQGRKNNAAALKRKRSESRKHSHPYIWNSLLICSVMLLVLCLAYMSLMYLQTKTPDSFNMRASELYEQGKYDEAMNIYQEGYNRYPNDIRFVEGIAKSAEKAGHSQTANIAWNEYRNSNHEEASIDIEPQAEEHEVTQPLEIKINTGGENEKEKEKEKKIEPAKTLTFDEYLNEANRLYNIGMYTRALVNFMKAFEQRNDDIRPYIGLSESYRAKGFYFEAGRILYEAEKKFGKNPTIEMLKKLLKGSN